MNKQATPSQIDKKNQNLLDNVYPEVLQSLEKYAEENPKGFMECGSIPFSFEFDILGFICEASGYIKSNGVQVSEVFGYDSGDTQFTFDRMDLLTLESDLDQLFN